MLSGKGSGNLPGISSNVLSGISYDIPSGILPRIYSIMHIPTSFCQWHTILAFQVSDILSGTLLGIIGKSSDILSSILPGIYLKVLSVWNVCAQTDLVLPMVFGSVHCGACWRGCWRGEENPRPSPGRQNICHAIL